MASGIWDADFFSELGNPEQFSALFDTLPGVYFFAKDRDGRFTAINGPLLVMMGTSQETIIGATDYDFFDRDLADAYRREDQRVMDSGESVLNAAWWVPNVATGDIHWYHSSKIPLRDRRDEIAGIAGIMREFEGSQDLGREHCRITMVANYIETHFGERLTIASLASVAGLSPRHFQRVFQRVFHTGPTEHVLRVRVRKAAARLVESNDPIARISIEAGFCDQSHFTNQFRRFRGMTPSEYRRRYRSDLA